MSKRWANKMRAIYITIFILIIAMLSAPSVYRALNVEYTCNDGLQNQGETAIDLSGPCHYLNPADLRPLVTKWARSFVVIPGLYSSVAYIQNSNLSGGIREVSYVFKLYDENNVLIADRIGKTFIPPGKIVPIFESNIHTGVRVPKRTMFKIVGTQVWERMETELAAEVFVAEKIFEDANRTPRLSAEVQNMGVYSLHNIMVIATIFDHAGNAIGASRTIIEDLPADSYKNVIFTWPRSFDSFVARTDIIPLLPPIDSL